MTENRKCVRIFDWLDIFPDSLEPQVMYIHSDGILVAQAAGGLPWDINVDNSPTPEITQKQFTFLTCTVDLPIMHSSMHYEITTKSIQLFAKSVQNPNMHYEIFYALWESLLYLQYIRLIQQWYKYSENVKILWSTLATSITTASVVILLLNHTLAIAHPASVHRLTIYIALDLW